MNSGQPLDLSHLKTETQSNSGTRQPFWRSILAKMAMALFGLPLAAWSRVLALFFGLVVVKLVLVTGMSKQLFEIHWRVGTPEINWWDYVSFFGLVCLAVVSLTRLASHCRASGIGSVRAANITVLGLGLIFILLTFHTNSNSDHNYVYPILAGVLDWNSLVPYLSLNLFFQAPFLGGWIFIYGLVYYVLARTGRELWALHVTAFFAGAYALIYLRELAICHNELLVVDCLGVVSLFMGRSTRGKLSVAWLLAPAVWSLCCTAQMLRLAHLGCEPSVVYFFTLVEVSAALFCLAAFFAHERGFLGAWSQVAFFYFSAFLLFTNTHYPLAPNLNRALCFGLEFPHYFAGEMFLAILVMLAARACWKVWPSLGFWWMDIVNLALITIALIDLRLAQIMGLRLDWNLLAFSNSPKMIWRMAGPYLPGVLASLSALAVIYLLAVRGFRWLLERGRVGGESAVTNNQKERRASGEFLSPGKSDATGRASFGGVWYAAVSFGLLCLLGVVVTDSDKARGMAAFRLIQTNPVWQRAVNRPLSPAEFVRMAEELGMGDLGKPQGTRPGLPPRDLNVVLIFQESSYNKHLSLFGGKEQTQPLLSQYKDQMEIFPDFFSNFASSIHARFATFTSLYPTTDYNAFTLQRVGVKSIFEVMHDQGYACSMFYSSFFAYTGFGDFLKHRGLDEMFDAETMPGTRTTDPVQWGLREEETLGAIRSQIKKYASGGQRFFLTYVPAAPHYPYEKVPERFHKFKPGEVGDYTPLYLNELLYMDWVQASILDQLKESGLMEKTLVIITDDHGEMLGNDGGPIGHGWVLTPELANAPLIILDPQNRGYRINHTIGSQVDLLPTVLDRLRIPMPAEQLYQGRNLDAPQNDIGHLAYLNSYQQYGIIAGDRIIMGDRERGKGKVADCQTAVFAISNQGEKTLFTADPSVTERPGSIRKFDEFQQSLLRNYSFYCENVRGEKRFAAGKSKK
jgi:hypothetical protein